MFARTVNRIATALLSVACLAVVAGCPDHQRRARPPGEGNGVADDDLAATLDLPERPFDYHRKVLDNGLVVLTLEDHSAPIAAVHLWYHVGSKDEKPDRRGFAHMFEHMMFRGTENIGPKAHFEYIRKVGGDTNAFTSFDNTTYIQTVPANQVEMVMWLEAERMAFLKINDEYFDTERNVVAEEYRLGREQPYGTAPDKILPKVFTKHPYAWTPIGDMDELRAADASELQEFWNTYYVPNNAALVVVGDVDHREVEAMAERYFGFIPRYPDPPRVEVREPPLTKPLHIEIKERNGPVPIVAIGWRTVPVGHADEVALQLLGSILGGGESSRLYRDLVDERELAMVALAGAFGLEHEGLLGAGGVLSPFGDDPDVVLAAIREHVQRIRTDGVTEAELRKAKNNMLRDAVASQLSVASKALMLGEAEVIGGDVDRVNRRFAEIRDVTVADIQRVAVEHLAPEREIELRVKPNLLGFIVDQIGKDEAKKTDEGQGPEEIRGAGSGKPGLARPDTLGTRPRVAPPTPPDVAIDRQTKTLANGLKVVAIENRELPFVNVVLGMDYGAWADPPDAPGLASVAVPMLTRGTKEHDHQALTDELDAHAISLGGSAGMDGLTVSGSALNNESERLTRLLAETVRTPTFPDEQLQKHIRQTRTGLAISQRSPGWLADRELRRRMFPGHPYARLAEAESHELDAITAAKLRTWWASHARPEHSVLYFAGDITPAAAFELAESHFGEWKASGPEPAHALPEVAALHATQIYLVDRPGYQSQIRVGHPGLTRRHADFVTARVMSDVFGGGFNSRLNDTIRVKKGLTYGAGGGFSAGRFAGRFVISTFSKNATVGQTVQTILEEIDRLKTEAPSRREQADSISYLLGSFAAARETPGDLLGALWQLDRDDLPADYYERYVEAVAKVKSEDVLAAAQRWVDEDHLVIVVVGPAKVLRPQLEAIAPVEVVQPFAVADE